MMSHSQILRAARGLIADKGWCQGDGKFAAHARAADGRMVNLSHDRQPNPEAVAYSIYGAVATVLLHRESGVVDAQPIWSALADAVAKTGRLPRLLTPIIGFNELQDMTREDVLAVMDEAVNALELMETPKSEPLEQIP